MDITEWSRLKCIKSKPVELILNRNRYRLSCGYRNIQMILSTMEMEYTILEIQSQIEKGWLEGWDRDGAIHFNQTLKNKICWIGATEVVVFFQSLGIGCRLFDFHRPTLGKRHLLLLQFCISYFKLQDQYPLYLQHHGHSRTIVGIESSEDELKTKLVLFDPEKGVETIGLEKLTHSQYQVVQVGVPMNYSKILTSTRLP